MSIDHMSIAAMAFGGMCQSDAVWYCLAPALLRVQLASAARQMQQQVLLCVIHSLVTACVLRCRLL